MTFGIQPTYTPVVSAGIGACVFIINGIDIGDGLCPSTMWIRFRSVVVLRFFCQELNLVRMDAVHRNPLVDRVDWLMEIHDLIENIR